jgi:hypothetical protein
MPRKAPPEKTSGAADRRQSVGRCLFRFGARLLLAVLSLLICAMAWFEWRGMPPAWVARFRAYLAENDLLTEIRAVRFQFPASVVVEGLRMYESPADQEPLLEADRIRLGWNPMSVLRRRAIGTLRIRGATITLRSRSSSAAEPAAPPDALVFSQINMYAWFSTNGVHLGLVEGLLSGIRIHGSAYIEWIPREPSAPPFSVRDFARTLRASVAQAAAYAPGIAKARDQIEFKSPPRLDFHLHWTPVRPEASHGTLRVTGFGAVFRGAQFDRWNANVLVTNGALNLRAASFIQGPNRCIARGQISLTNDMAVFHLYSTLLPKTWCCFAPVTNIPEWTVELRPESRSHFELFAGPAPKSRLAENIRGWVELQNTRVMRVDVRRFFAHAGRQGDLLKADYAEINLPDLRFRGEARLEISSLNYEVRGSVEGDPRSALPWLPEGPADVVRDLDAARHLTATGRAAGCFTNLQAFCIEARGGGVNFIFRGVQVTNFETALYYSNDVLVLRDMLVQRPEGKAEGWVGMDFAQEHITFDAVSTIAPHAAARMLGSNVFKFLSPFRFEGAAEVSARGLVDYGALDTTDLSAVAKVRRAGWDRFIADEANMDVIARGRSVLFTNITGAAYGGAFGGVVTIENIGNPSSPPRYDVQVAIREADFKRVIEEIRGLTNLPYQGTLSATVAVAGAIGEGMGRSAEGAGKLEIRGGHLFQLPLLGGLSRLLSKIYPGLGFATQTDLESAFVIADGAVCSDDVEMQGTVLSVLGSGCCRFDGHLDGVVQVKLLRRSYPAYVLRVVTLPVTKLLEFHLSGTVDDPRWRPQNLPKEMFLIFD